MTTTRTPRQRVVRPVFWVHTNKEEHVALQERALDLFLMPLCATQKGPPVNNAPPCPASLLFARRGGRVEGQGGRALF